LIVESEPFSAQHSRFDEVNRMFCTIGELPVSEDLAVHQSARPDQPSASIVPARRSAVSLSVDPVTL